MAVVYVDDDETICWLLQREWKTACPEHPIHTVHTPAQALAKVAELGGALVALVVDWRLTGTTGEKLVRELRVRQPALCIIATSAVTDAQQLEAARAAGADRFIEKDISMQVFARQLAQSIDRIVKERKAAPGSEGKQAAGA
jgi:DNA-binding NtrC family response regulator